MMVAGRFIQAKDVDYAEGIGPFTYIHVGDSETQGSSDDTLSTTATRDMSFHVAFASGGKLVQLGNGGKGGQTGMAVASRIKRLLRRKPGLMGVTIGTNDVFLGLTAYTTPALDIIKRAADAVGTKWFVTTIPPTNQTAFQSAVLALNTSIKAWAAANGVRCVDVFSAVVASDGVSWQTNYNLDQNHWHSRGSWIAAQYIWSQISDMVPSNRHWAPGALDPANLLFTPIKTDGSAAEASTTLKEPLFVNHRSFTQNGITVDAPYLFAAQFPSGTAPTVVSSTYTTVAGVAGNVWTLTLSPNGAGSYTAQSGSSNRIDVSAYQGRRLRLGFKLGMAGFGVDNTLAYLAANADVPLSGFGLLAAFYHLNGTAISTIALTDPIDVGGTVAYIGSTAKPSNIPMGIQALFGRQDANGSRWMIDHDLLPVYMELNVPAGAATLDLTYIINFLAGATSAVSVSMAEFSLIDIGPFEVAELRVDPITSARKVTAAYTVPDYDGLREIVHECDATSAAFTVTLASALAMSGHRHTFIKIDSSANAVTLDGSGSETINGATTQTLSTQWAKATVYSDGKQLLLL